MKFNEIDFSIKNLLIVGVTIFILSILYATRDILILFVLSVLIAYLLNPVVEFFVKGHIPRFISVLILVLILVFLFILLLAGLVPVMIKDITYLIKHAPEYINNIFMWLEEMAVKFDINTTFDLETSKTYITERIGVISSYLLNTLTSAKDSVINIAGVVANIFIVPVIVFFLLTDFPNFKAYTVKLIERFNMKKVMEHISQFETLVGKYFRGMFLVGLILSFLYGGVLYMIGVKGWFFIGLLTGFGAMIPYVGFTIGLISAVIASYLTFTDFIHPIYTIAGYIAVQVLESMVITPKIVGESLGISPVVVIIGLMIGGALAGFIGMIVALPVAAFIKILIDTYVFGKPLPNKSAHKNHNKEDNNQNKIE